ncbi:tail assembly protein, partial [Glaesserella parasuis]|nr:tail assembly protein [Glaesserella parasuis]
DCTVHFTPVVAGAGKNMNVMNIVIGVVLIAASWYAGGAAGWGYLGAQAGATMAFTVGASMVLSGVMGLLTKPPSMDTKFSDSDKQQSTSFSNIRNLTPQGRPIPLLYGKMMTSLILISQGIDTFDDIPQGT